MIETLWMNHYVKSVTVAINDFHKKICSSNMDNPFMFKNLQNQLTQSIHTAKQKYFIKIGKKLHDPLTSIKCYWSLLKVILKGMYKILKCILPCIPLIFLNNNMSQILKKRVTFSTLFPLISAP